MSALRRYGAVLRAPHAGRLVATAIVARASVGLDGLAIVLFLRTASGSYAVAGAAAAAFAAAAAMAGPYVGRLIDRLGARRVLVPAAALHAAGLVGVVVLGEAGVIWAAVLAATFAGALIPPIGSVMRALWPELLADAPELLTAAYALDAAIVEIAFVVGPLIVAAAYALSGAQLALLLSAALCLGGTLLFMRSGPARAYHPAADHARHEHHGGLFGVLRAPGMRTLVLTTLPIGYCLGASEVTFPGFGESVGNRGYAGVLIAVWSLGSGVGGILYGARPHTRGLPDVYVRLLAAVPLATLPLAAPSSLAAMLPLAFVAGLAVAPTIAAGNQLVGDVAPPGSLTEAYTWPLTTLVAGVAAGNAAAGAIVQAADWRLSFLVAAGVGSLATLLAAARRGTLGPPA